MNPSRTLMLILSLFNINLVYAADTGVQACQAALSKRQYPQAIQAAEQASSLPNAWLCKGRAQAALQKLDVAQHSFEQAIQLKPQGLDLISAYMLLGNVQQARQQTEAAVSSYQQALALAQAEKMPRYVMVADNLIGEAMFAAGQYASALEAFQAGEKLAMNDNERADSFEHEAMTYHRMQQLDKAVEYQLKAVLMQRKSGSPDQYAEASLTLGLWFVEQKDFKGADQTYQRLMQFARDNGGSFYEAKTAILWAQAKRAQGDAAAADALIKQAQTLAVQLKDQELDALLKEMQ